MPVDPHEVSLTEKSFLQKKKTEKSPLRFGSIFHTSIMVWDYYNGKTVFITGGTGFIGTVLLYRLLSQSSPERVYVLCRGGEQ